MSGTTEKGGIERVCAFVVSVCVCACDVSEGGGRREERRKEEREGGREEGGKKGRHEIKKIYTDIDWVSMLAEE